MQTKKLTMFNYCRDQRSQSNPPLIVAVTSADGGTGKTTTIVNLAAELAVQGQKVLLVDIDPACHAAQHIGDRCEDMLVMQTVLSRNWSYYRSNPAFVGVECISFSHNAYPEIAVGELCDILEFFSFAFDFILIDCPPGLTKITETALSIATHYLTLVDTENGYSATNLANLASRVSSISKISNPKLLYIGTVLNRMREAKCNQMIANQVKTLTDQADPAGTLICTLMPVSIRHCEAVGRASLVKCSMRSVSEYIDDAFGIANDYTALTHHLMRRLGI
jgi:chromosome partitioning protein